MPVITNLCKFSVSAFVIVLAKIIAILTIFLLFHEKIILPTYWLVKHIYQNFGKMSL